MTSGRTRIRTVPEEVDRGAPARQHLSGGSPRPQVVALKADSGIPPSPPKHLSAEAAALWATYTGAWDLDEHALVVLTVALEAFMRMREAQAVIQHDGLVLKNGRINPAIAIERDTRRDFASALKSLGLVLDSGQAAR